MSTHVPGFQSLFGFFASFCIGHISQQQHNSGYWVNQCCQTIPCMAVSVLYVNTSLIPHSHIPSTGPVLFTISLNDNLIRVDS